MHYRAKGKQVRKYNGYVSLLSYYPFQVQIPSGGITTVQPFFCRALF